MKDDRVARKKQRFTPENHLIHGGKRQTSKQRQCRLEDWLSTFTPEQLWEQTRRHLASMERLRPGSTQRVSAWRI